MENTDFKPVKSIEDDLIEREMSFESSEMQEHLNKEKKEETAIENSDELDNFDLTTDEDESIEITITNLDGSNKTIILGEIEKTETKEEIIQRQLIELKDYINNNKDKIDTVGVNKGNKFHKKIPLKDFINKELNTTNYNSNPEKLGEDIILSLLKPLKVYNNYLGQNRLEKNQGIQKENKIEKSYTVSINDQEYQFKNYSEDFKKIIVADSIGRELELANNKNVNFIITPEKKFNATELDLINQGKSLIQSSEIPFKVSSENGVIKYQTITSDEFEKNINKMDVKNAKEIKSVKQSV